MCMKEMIYNAVKCLLTTGGVTPTKETEKIMTVLLGISAIYSRVLETTAAVGAYEIVATGEIELKESVSQYITVISSAAADRLMSEIATLFDTAGRDNQENCSLKLLRNMCLQDAEHFPLGENDEMMLRLDELFNDFNSSSLKKSRNKQLSHHDFHQILSGEQIVTVYEDEEVLVIKIGSILTDIIHRYNNTIQPPFPNLGELKQQFRESLESLKK